VKPIEILQGKWLGHSLHVAIVHIPVCGWLVACIVDIANWQYWTPAPYINHLALYLVAFGLLGALVAIPSGLADWLPIRKHKPTWKIGMYHIAINVVATALWAYNLSLRLKSNDRLTTAILLTSLAGSALVFISGYLGSLMVSERDAASAPNAKKEWREITH